MREDILKRYEAILVRYEEWLEKVGDVRNAGASIDNIEWTLQLAKEYYNANLPADYVKFLSLCDGFGHCGLTIYCSAPSIGSVTEWVVENNLVSGNDSLRDFNLDRQYLILAYDGEFIFVTDLLGMQPRRIAMVGDEVEETYDSVGSMLISAIEEALADP